VLRAYRAPLTPPDNLSAVDCLRKALGNLRDLFTSIKDKYEHSLQ
jgi:DNA-directed RNA polymerase I and III subunit RPAC2